MIFGGTSWMLAWRYFRARREHGLVSIVTAFSIAGLAVGVAALIISMAVFTGFRLELRDRLFRLEGPLKVRPVGGNLLNWDPEYTSKIAENSRVTQIVPFVSAPAIVFKGEAAEGALFRGIRGQDMDTLPFIDFLQEGRTPRAGSQDGDEALIGTALARELDLDLGEQFRAYEAAQVDTDDETPTLPTARSFLVVGIFDSGVAEVDKGLVLTDPMVVRSLRGIAEGNIFEGAQVYLNDHLALESTLADLSLELFDLPLTVGSSLDPDPLLDGRLGMSAAQHLQLARDQEAAMVVILALIIVVAAFGVIAGQMMKVREKAREIAVLRSFGASRGLILQVFLLLGLFIGILGALIGTVIGLLLATYLDEVRVFLEGITGLSLFPADQFRLAFLPSRPTFGAVGLSVSMALILTLLAMAYPAFRASRLSPAEALRYE